MKELYNPNTANYPRLKTDVCFADYDNEYTYTSTLGDAFRFVRMNQLTSRAHWKRFCDQFRYNTDNDTGWRGEFWGKMMRGACFCYSYFKDKELYDILTETVKDMMTTADSFGRISSYPRDREFNAWDLWCRKYVLLGMQYYLEICEDDSLKEEIIASMCRQLDYIMTYIGQGKKEITKASCHWRGLNSASILEPTVRLYTLTKNESYLSFAKYIVDKGFTDVQNLVDLAFEDGLSPYQYPVTKAYEMTSCFEGLLEYYRITGEEKYKKAIIRFADKVLETDFTVIGCSGCTHELFDHSTVRQANTTNGAKMQETCVTVTLMKFFYQVHLLTGDVKYADAFETSLYNAYLGSFNTEKVIEPQITNTHPTWTKEALPFDSYSPLTSGTRGNGVGGLQYMPDNHYYGCCACIASAGIGLAPKMQFLTTHDGYTLNIYENGTIKTDFGKIEINGSYLIDGKVSVTMNMTEPKKFSLKLRNSSWSKKTSLKLNGSPLTINDGYMTVTKEWQNGDKLELEFDMTIRVTRPIPYGEQVLMNEVVWSENYIVPVYDKEDENAKYHLALRRGALMLGLDDRTGKSPDTAVSLKLVNETVTEYTLTTAPYPHILALELTQTDGTKLTLTDYASTGKRWDIGNKTAVWLKTK